MIYKINMSKGGDIKIDEQDLIHLQQNLSAPLIRLKQAIINPSFMISIVPTDEEDIIEKPQLVERDGVMVMVGKTEVKKLSDLMSVKNENLQSIRST